MLTFLLLLMIDPHLSPHVAYANARWHWDVILWLAFFAGQMLFVLKRTALAIRSKLNPIRTRWQYVFLNWDILLIRMVIELPVYYAYRHADFNTLLSKIGWQLPFEVPQGIIASIMVGFLADSLLDWYSGSKIAPDWLKENIPQIPAVAAIAQETKQVAPAPAEK